MKEIFVLGAGASVASAGIPFPSGKELVWTYYQDCRGFSEVDGCRQVTVEDKRKAREQFADLLKFLKSRPEFKAEAEQLEQMLNGDPQQMFDVPKCHYIDELMDTLQKENNQEIMRLIKCLTFKHIADLSSNAPNELYKAFVQKLVITNSDVSIISFNFDCLLEVVSRNKICFDHLFPFQEIARSRKVAYQEGRRIPLIKLHGSVDWVCNLKTGAIKLHYLPVEQDKYYGSDGSLRGAEEPYIFLPHQTKDDRIGQLWKLASDALRQADKITVIGYSFPDYDKDVIDLFRNNVGAQVAWEVIDFEDNPKHRDERRLEVQNKYKELFPKIQKPVIHVDGFEGYISRMEKVCVKN